MSYALAFHPEAAAELECVAGDYDARELGLGSRFRRAIESACAAIVEQPLLWRERPRGYRRVNVSGFPYYVAFVLRDHLLFVVVVAHSSRNPDYWIGRMP
jgi:plasmid stabilization system protein ParE